jgi:hypothetical protein
MKAKHLFRSALLGVAMLTGLQASATHFRFGLVTATRLSETSTTVTYRIDVQESWRDGTASVTSPFLISGGNSGTLNVTMTIVNDPIGDWDNSSGSATVTLNKSSTPTRIEYTDCCKISTIENNNDQNWDEYIILNTNAAGSSPQSSLPAIVNLPVGLASASFAVPGSDVDAGTTLTWGQPNLATGPLAGQTQPPGWAINSLTGMASMNTTGQNIGDLFNAMTTITDNNGNQIELDFIIRMVANSHPPYFNYAVTPENAHVFTAAVGVPLSFTIAALDSDASSTVGLSASGLNSFITAANFSPAFPNTGAGGTSVGFSYTPTSAEAGSSYLLNFIATDNFGVQALSSVTINVSACTAYSTSISAAGSTDNCRSGAVYRGYGGCTTLTASATGGTTPYTFTWSTAATGNTISVCPTTATTYTVSAVDANGCPSSSSTSTSFPVQVIDVRCGNNMNKVQVCHRTSSTNNPFNAICISASDVPNHLAHGDCLGDCAEVAQRGAPNTSNNVLKVGGGIEVFPNPAMSGTISIALKDNGSIYQSYQITDINGRVMRTEQITTDVYADVITVDISGYAKGIYIVKAVNGDGALLTKFVVQ